MKNLFKLILSETLLFGLYSCGGPSSEQKAVIDAQAQTEKDLEMYRYVWGLSLIHI